MELTLGTVDNIVVVGFAMFLLWVSYYFSKTVKDMESFFLGNRSLPWSLIVGTMVATWYGGVGTVGSVEYAALYGVSMWAVYCVTAHLGRMPLALWVGPRIHIRTDVTVPDLLNGIYGKGVALLGAVLMFLYCTQIGEITAMGLIAKAAWNIDAVLGGTLCVVLVAVMTIFGGLMGVAVTDMILFWCMCFGLTMITPGQWTAVGGWAGLEKVLAASNAGNLLDPLGGLTFMKGLMLCVLAFGVYADPAFYQRFSASESPKSGRRALLTCFIIWVSFDIVLTVAGLIVKVKYPDMHPGIAYIKLVMDSLPVGVRALFIIGVIGSIISTLDSYYLVGGATLANDIYARIKGNVPTKTVVKLTRIGVVIVSVLGILVAFQFTMAQDAFIFLAGVWMAAGFVPIVGGLMWPGKITPTGGYLGMITGLAVFALVKIFPPQSFELEPLIAALPISFIAWLIGNQIGHDVRISAQTAQADIIVGEQTDRSIEVQADKTVGNQTVDENIGGKMIKEKMDLEISWLGLDGFLVAAYFVVCATIYYGIVSRSDLIIGWIIPIGVMATVSVVFVKYLSVVFTFAKQAGNRK